MRIKMTMNYDHRLKPAVVQAFRAGREYSVPKKTALAAIKAGAADQIKLNTTED